MAKKKFYHATEHDPGILANILDKGLLPGCDGIVYLAETKEDALKFVALRFYEETLVIEVELEESEVEETFDHNYSFFNCRAFGYASIIPGYKMTNFWKYERKF